MQVQFVRETENEGIERKVRNISSTELGGIDEIYRDFA